MKDLFLKELFYNNAYSTDDKGYRYYVIEAFSNVYTLKVWYDSEDNYTIVDWKNESA
jgi:hypothetical protein